MVNKKVKLIENSRLRLNNKIDTLLVYAGQKPATSINLSCSYGVGYDKIEKDVSYLEKLFGRLNLSYVAGDYRCEDDKIWLPFCISKNSDGKDLLLSAFDDHNTYEKGRCYGYPETAIQAFHGDIPSFVGHFDYGLSTGYFTHFVFSQYFFKEEFETTSLRWYDYVNKLSPKLISEASKHEYLRNTFGKSIRTWR